MKPIKNLKYALVTALALTACFAESCKKSNVDKPIAANAVVLDTGDISVDGCGWLLKINGTDSLYSPSNLADSYKVGSLKVNVTYTVLSSKFQCGQLPHSGITQIKLATIAKQ